MGMVTERPMQGWSVAVSASVAGNGSALTSIFVVTRTAGEAVSAAVRHLFDSLDNGNGTPLITITGTQATAIDRQVIEAAASELGMRDMQPG